MVKNNGKNFSLGTYKNIRIDYGTVNYINLKAIYLTLETWVDPLEEVDYQRLFSNVRFNIKNDMYNLNHPFFKKESIVDLDIRTANIYLGKKSFMNISVTLYVEHQFDIRGESTKETIRGIAEDIIDLQLIGKIPFDFYKNRNDEQ